MKKVVLSIDGMTCSACSNGLEKYLNKQNGIKSATVNLVMANALIEYDENILTCTRQFRYSTENENSIDMVLSLNGIPIVALELKNQLTGQNVDNAKKQYMYDRLYYVPG